MTERAHRIREFERQGFLGPVRLMSDDACRALARAYASGDIPPGLCWHKGVAASSRFVFDVATRPDLLDRVSELLGHDVMLWGASLIERRPGEQHGWHTDIETSDPGARSVSVWIGLAETNEASSLRLIAGTHQVGKSIQEVAREVGCPREMLSGEEIAHWARDLGADAACVVPTVRDGEGIFFDGRLWHGSNNENRSGTRLALLLQYATPDTAIRMPMPEAFEWPFQFLDERPPVIAVRGAGHGGPNRFVSAPPEQSDGIQRDPWVRNLDLPLAQYAESGWSPHNIFRGETPCTGLLSCHASVLAPGLAPHAPHSHDEEEILIVLDGEAELVVQATGDGAAQKQIAALPGTVAYYPSGCLHTLRNRSKAPVSYLMFKWVAARRRRRERLTAEIVPGLAVPRDTTDPSFATEELFGGATRYLETLHMHRSTLGPSGGYAGQTDPYDVALVVTSGTVETVDRDVCRGGVVFYPAGVSHGIRNKGATPATYLVVEFHGSGGAFVKAPPPLWRRVMRWGRRNGRAAVRRWRRLRGAEQAVNVS